MPTFSIVVTAYKNSEYLPACLQSLVDQSFLDWECVVVNDASPDETSAVAHKFSDSDRRFRVLDLVNNVGLHLARRAGVQACRGDYVIFLDADDDFDAEGLSRLAEAVQENPADILHFGISVISDGADADACEAFENNVNGEQDAWTRDQLLNFVFAADGGYLQDWRVTQRAYRLHLARDAFEAMTSGRLERAEDCYEFFVLADKATSEVTVNDIRLLNYHFGRGVTGTSSIDAATFARFCEQFKACIDVLFAYAEARGLGSYADGAKSKLLDLLMNDWLLRVHDDDKKASAHKAAEVLGNTVISTQLMRISRDAAYADLVGDRPVDENASCFRFFALGEDLAGKDCPDEDYLSIRDEARSHLSDLERVNGFASSTDSDAPTLSLRSAYESEGVRIFVTTHKNVNFYHSYVLQPVQVGARSPRRRLLWAFQDDTGSSIADQNAMYCELTTQYWAWKNADAQYYGFCHYRRYFDFSDVEHEENVYGEVMDRSIDWDSQKRYSLDDDSIRSAVEGYDIVTTGIKDLRDFPEEYESTYDHYARAPYLKIADLDRVINILNEMHPDYAADADAYLAGHLTCFCNMYVMRKELFFRYCEWMFPILEKFVEGWDTSLLSHETLRTPGHLSERLFNIWLTHEKRVNSSLRHKQVQCVHFEEPDHVTESRLEPADSHGKPVVPVVFAADINYVPMVTTAIYSMLANASDDYFYDVYILEKDIGPYYGRILSDFFGSFENASVRCVNVNGYISKYDLKTSNEHISVETYYRFLIQMILPGYDKVIYLDSDLIVNGDISELYALDLGDNLIAAARDIDYLGNLNMNDGERLKYSDEVLVLVNPYDYFQAGVLVLNTVEMRKLYPFQKWLEIASEPKYIYDDQDILNAHCQGRVVYLENEWNVMNDCCGRISNVFTHAPANIYDAFMRAYARPKVLHYAGFQKPWKPGPCDLGEYFWVYARNTPFYERLLGMHHMNRVEAQEHERALYNSMDRRECDLRRELDHRCGVLDEGRLLSENNPVRAAVDVILPQGSHRREAAKDVVRKIRYR